MSGEIFEIPYGSRTIGFQLERRPRKTMAISVKPDLKIEVVAPLDASLNEIVEKVRKRAPWITRQVQYFHQFHPRTPDRRYIAGETHMYLGRQYKLKIVQAVQQGVKLYRGRLIVESRSPRRPERTKELVDNWYKARAHIKFHERIKVCRDHFPDPALVEPSGVMIRRLKQRWGSMTPAGRLVLNPALLGASVDAIDYVITHELCHLEHAHHGPAFMDSLSRVMPDWEKRKLKLERQLA